MIENLSERYREILDVIISDYIASAEPVGSRTISKRLPLNLSPATVRNVMADLTDIGLLVQPHTSAGRVPTPAAFRYYVDSLLSKRELSEHEMDAIRDSCHENESGMGDILQRTSRMLAAISSYAGLVITPGSARVVFKQLQFIKLSARRILGIFVSQDGLVQNRLIDIAEEYSFPELERIANYCNQVLSGLCLEDAIEKLDRELASEREDYDRLLKDAMQFAKVILEEVPSDELVVDGQMQLLREPEFTEIDRFRQLVEAIEEKKKICNILKRCSEGEGVKIFIGSNADVDGMGEVGLVGAPYFKDGKIVGSLGVIGPIRMNYAHVVPIVDFTAKVVSDMLNV